MNSQRISAEPSIQKEDYIAIAAHQLRTPLTTLRWFLGPFLAGEFGALTEAQRKFLSAFSLSTERMIDLVDTILNASRIERGDVQLKREETDLAAFTEKLYEEILPLANDKSQKFSYDCPKDQFVFSTDQRLLHEILSNLLHNAIRYTPVGGEISFAARIKGADILFAVQDMGLGIPKEEQKHIFEKLFRASNVAFQFPDGTGLGLYVAKFFTELLGGRIWFESEEGRGTVFYVTIPFVKS